MVGAGEGGPAGWAASSQRVIVSEFADTWESRGSPMLGGVSDKETDHRALRLLELPELPYVNLGVWLRSI